MPIPQQAEPDRFCTPGGYQLGVAKGEAYVLVTVCLVLEDMLATVDEVAGCSGRR